MSLPHARPPTVVDFRTLRPLISLPSSVVKKSPDEHPLISFTVLTYNILAQGHIYRDGFPYCGKDTLRWKHRRVALATEIEAYDADIVCFQEMDRFHDYFQPLLHQLGYEMKYFMRNGPDSDVNCVGWKQSKFKLLDSRQVSFEGTTMGMGAVPNVAQFCALEDVSDSRLRIAIATTHLFWRMEYDHVRLAQMHTLTAELLQFCTSLSTTHGGPSFIPIIAGDLNSDHESMAIQAALRSDFLMSPDAYNTMLEKSQMAPPVLRQILSDFTVNWPKFYDAYGDYASTFPGINGYPLPYTSFSMYKGVLDHILYMQCPPDEHLRIAPTALRMLPERAALEVEYALPNRMFSSDHLALNVEFTVFHNHSNTE